jgi:hypothetical protein
MKKLTNKWAKALIVIIGVALLLTGAGYLGLQYLKSELNAKLSSCTLENKSFITVLDFDYVANWIVVKVKIEGNDKEYPFIFDTGAQTVVSDSLLKEIGSDNYGIMTSGGKKDSIKNAFKNEIITIKELQIGDLKFHDIGAITTLNSKWDMLNCVSAYGIIGYNILNTCGFQIDYGKKKIILTDQVESLENYGKIEWVNFTTPKNQETPIISAVINDSIKVNLFFDTGSSGGIKLSSTGLYKAIIEKFPKKIAKYSFTPTIRIRGEQNELVNSMLFQATTFSLGGNLSEDININVENTPEREFSGFVGNKYLENYIATVDYKNMRVGFLPHERLEREVSSTFGFSFTPTENKLVVTSVFEGSQPERQGILVGDEIVSINGTKISELPAGRFCEIYRNEYDIMSKADSILSIEIMKNGNLMEYRFNRQNIFD